MASFSNILKNEKSLSNVGLNADATWDGATMTLDEAERPWDALGLPITKMAKNNKSLSNESENL